MKFKKDDNGHTVVMSKNVVVAIRDHIGNYRAERGGMLGRDPDGVIRHFQPDHNGHCNAGAYDPDIDQMNRVIKFWKADGIEFCGFAHSHPPDFRQLSGHDQWYAGEILDAFKRLRALVLPIIQTVPDTGKFEILPFIAVPEKRDRKNCSVSSAELCIVEGVIDENLFGTNFNLESTSREVPGSSIGFPVSPTAIREAVAGVSQPNCRTWNYYGHFGHLWNRSAINPTPMKPSVSPTVEDISEAQRRQAAALIQRDKYLSRIAKGLDLGRLDRTRLVVIGTGGAASFIRNSARMGFGEFVLIDPDHVTETNVATQQADPDAIGQAKVEALAKDIVRLNPAAEVVAVVERVEEIDDQQFSLLFKEPLRENVEATQESATDLGFSPLQTILLVLTDNFEAQARGHRLGLQFGLPTICAQEYVEGRGAEVTYTVAGITPACHRCITASRYRAYLDEGYRNDVTSEGAPIFAAEMLNAVLGHVLLAIAHHGTEHPRWGKLIERLGNRNLIVLRMDPDFDASFGDKFGKRLAGAKEVESFIMLDSLFLPQTPDCGQSPTRPTCPDCGGTGHLEESIGRFEDTRIMPLHESDKKTGESTAHSRRKQAIAAYEQSGRAK